MILAEPVHMHPHGLSHAPLHLFTSITGGDTAGEIGGVSRIVAFGPLDDHEVLVQVYLLFRPACFRMLLKVPAARSSFAFPASVTLPAFVG